MLPVNVSARTTPESAAPDIGGSLGLVEYLEYLRFTHRGNPPYELAARKFFDRWPNPGQWSCLPLEDKLAADSSTRPIITFLMLHGGLHPGYDYLLHRKLSPIWRELATSPLRGKLDVFLDAAQSLGFSERVRLSTGSQVPIRLLIQTGRAMEQWTLADLREFARACDERQAATGKNHIHYRSAISATHRVLFHVGVLQDPPTVGGPTPLSERLAEISVGIRGELIAYLERKRATCDAKTVSSSATKLKHFGLFLTRVDPSLTSVAGLDRRRHVEPFLTSLLDAVSEKTGTPISLGERHRRVVTLATFLTDITEWGWDAAPARKVLFRDDIPKLPQVLPRYIPLDADRRLTQALTEHPVNPIAAAALRLQRSCGLRIGELLDLELDCVHQVPANGSWLKVPLGKLATERMIPLDEETVALIDEIITIRSPGRALPHPRYRRPAQFLFTHHGRRVGPHALRRELDHATTHAGLGHITSHQLRHTYATALVNAGVSLQALMALLGHVSAEMSLRYGRLFDATVRTEYERALALAKANAHATQPDTAHPDTSTPGYTQIPLSVITGGGDWIDAPFLKSRMAGGFCLRAPAQGACTYANICEHCPSYRSEPSSLPILASQRVDAQSLARDAEERGWIDEAQRHHALIARLDSLIANTQENTP